MGNSLGSSGSSFQAPPPPPLPQGMIIETKALQQAPPPQPLPQGMQVETKALQQAPPPPPLPQGMQVETKTLQQAPPPPPLPQGMQVETKTLQQAPPPPPLPQGMQVESGPFQPNAEETPKNGDCMQNILSFAETEKQKEAEEQARIEAEEQARIEAEEQARIEAEEQARIEAEEQARIEAEEQAKREIAIKGGMLGKNDKCYARSKMDGLYYFATIDSFGDKLANLVFFSNERGLLPFDKIYTISCAREEMQCFANWNSKGTYFPAVIEEVTNGGFVVHYDENPSIKETLGFDKVRFALR